MAVVEGGGGPIYQLFFGWVEHMIVYVQCYDHTLYQSIRNVNFDYPWKGYILFVKHRFIY